MIDCLYDCFKHWAANGSVGVLSDPHFCDADCKTMNKNWISPDEHVAMINRKWHKNDTLILLGDLGDPEYVKQIKAKKILLTGNHDIPHLYRDIVDELYTGPLWIAEKILLSHEPIVGLVFVVNIHGHDHAGKMRWIDAAGAKHVNVASNVCGWMPINLSEEIKNGLVSRIPDIHRVTIDNATKNSIKKKNRVARKNGEPEIAMPVRKPKKTKAPQTPVLTAEEKREKRVKKMCDNYCASCPSRTVDLDNLYINGGCAKFNEASVVVVNRNTQVGHRKVFTPMLPYNEKAAREYFYASNEKMDGDKFIFCQHCPEMLATIVSTKISLEKVEKKETQHE